MEEIWHSRRNIGKIHSVSTPTLLITSTLIVNRPNLPDFSALISHPLTLEERISLITTIFSEYDQPKVGRSLSRADYQAIVDIMDEVSTYVLLPLRKGWIDPPCIFG